MEDGSHPRQDGVGWHEILSHCQNAMAKNYEFLISVIFHLIFRLVDYESDMGRLLCKACKNPTHLRVVNSRSLENGTFEVITATWLWCL